MFSGRRSVKVHLELRIAINQPCSLHDIPDSKLTIYVQIKRFFRVRKIASPAT
jgi:hypothetical protein